IGRLAVDTYVREVERYGGPDGMLLAERLFAADSLAVLAIVEAYDDEMLADARWRLALVGMDRLLGDLGFDLDEKTAIVRTARDRFAREQGSNQELERRLGE